MPKLECGQIVQIHSLQSEAGKKLNGKAAFVIRYVVEEKRYEVRIRNAQPLLSTKSIKPDNLKVIPKLSLPDGSISRPRGIVMDYKDDDAARILCELLVLQHATYTPPTTQMTGYAALALSRFDRFSLKAFTCVEMEWFACLFALTDLIKKSGKSATEQILFAFLEGDPMYVDVLILSMTFTPFIGPEEEVQEKNAEFRKCSNPRKQLTPDQQTSPYATALLDGPISLLLSLAEYKFGYVFFNQCIQQSPVYPMLIQRLLRWVAREGMGTPDGTKLGPSGRKLLTLLCKEDMSEQVRALMEQGPLEDEQLSKALLSRTHYFDTAAAMKMTFTRTFSEISYGHIM